MKVILDIDAIKYPLTGIGRYALEVAKAMQCYLSPDELIFLNHYTLQNQLPQEENITTLPQSNVFSAFKERAKKNRLMIELYRQIVPRVKIRALKKHSHSVYHSPNFYLPPGITKSVATFHDLSVFICPQHHPKERVRFMTKALLETLQRANLLITPSEYIRQELIEYFDFPAERVFTTQLACSNDFYPRSGEEVFQVLSTFGLQKERYTLFTGTIEPRKNIEVLLRAYKQLPISERRACPLVINGYYGWNSEKIHQMMQQAQQEGWLHYLGFVKTEALPILYAGAKLFVFPSLYEGFGLPVLEAMASGTPVVSSNAASLPEVVGDAALLCNPSDVDSLFRQIQYAMNDNIWQKKAISLGIKRAEQFSWSRCAKETISVYEQLSD